MRKQAITFLSLFTLILVLSIYYLLVPPIEEEKTNVSTQQSSSIEIMQEELQQSHENSISENNDVIASSKSSQDEIDSALTSISKTKEIMKKWGADAVRDCDGTSLPANAKELGKVYYHRSYSLN